MVDRKICRYQLMIVDTTYIKLSLSPLLFSEGEYKIVNYSAPDCVTLKYEGKDLKEGEEITIDKSKPTFAVTATEDCFKKNTGVSITFALAPVIDEEAREDLQKIIYRIVVRPLAVKFEDLVKALTCSDFDIKNSEKFKNEVIKSVLSVAFTGSGCPEGMQLDEPIKLGDYTWSIGGDYISAKKEGEPTATDFDFKIILPDGKFGVWVNSVPKDNACDEVKGKIFTPELEKQYQNYNLHLVINGNDCLPKYGVADYYHRREQLLSYKPYATWAGSCIATVGLCKLALGVASAGTMGVKEALTGWKDYASCVVAPGIAYTVNLILSRFDKEPTRAGVTVLAPLQTVDATRAFRTNYTEIKAAETAIKTAGKITEGLGDTDLLALAKQGDKIAEIVKKVNPEYAGQADKFEKYAKFVLENCTDTESTGCKTALSDFKNFINPPAVKEGEKTIGEIIAGSAKKYEQEMRLDTRAKWISLCGPIGQVVGGITGSIYMISTYVGAPTLTVQIYTDPFVIINPKGKTITAKQWNREQIYTTE